MLAVLLAAAALAGTGPPPRRAQRRIATQHAVSRAEFEACEVVSGAHDQRACLESFLGRWQTATVRSNGRSWPVNAPDVPDAKARRGALALLDALRAARAEAEREWQELVPRLENPGAATLSQLEDYIERWEEAVVRVDGADTAVAPATLDDARTLLPRVRFEAALVVLPEPAWGGRFAAGSPRPPVRFTVRSSKRNEVIDDARWFREVDWTVPMVARQSAPRGFEIPTLPSDRTHDLPANLGGEPFHRAILDGDLRVVLYGAGSRVPIVGVFEPDTPTLIRAFDFSTWETAPNAARGDEDFVHQAAQWATVRGRTLYVSHFHRTYARSSGGQNAYVAALDLDRGELTWRSEPLSCNAGNFVVTEDHVICGYGFTAEPDHLVLLDRGTGRTLSRTPVKTGPDWVLLRGDVLFLRTYDTDYVFDVEAR
jgi:hypothetical protein